RRGERPMEWTQDLERTDPETGKVTAVQTTALPNRGGMSCWAGENPAVTWKEIVEARLIAKRKGAGAMQAFTNNMLARAWSPRSSFREVSVSELESRTLRYPAQLPDDVIFLTAFVDAQRGKDDGRGQRVEISVYGWGRENTAYLICHHVIEGEPYSAAVEREQELFLERSYRNASGFHLKVVMAACDAGSDFSAAVKDYCRKYTDKGKGRIATHGHKDEQGTGCLYGSLINANGNYNSKRAWDFYFIDTLRGKDELAEKLELGPRIGGIFFPWSAAYLPNYFAGLNAERKMPHKKGWKWKRKGALTGEPLDCYVGAAAARDFVKARNPIFADIEQVIARAPWIVPASPSLVTNPWEGDCMSVQADDIRRVRGLPPVDGSIAARALAVMAAASSRGGGVRSALTEKPEAAIAERGPRVVAGDNGSHGGGWSGGADPGTGGWGT
ncbi:MAG: phage terminase gpa, partial [Acidobacteria bacterium]|nr:phage terminase gpa [Acidobacteriota bacterium]